MELELFDEGIDVCRHSGRLCNLCALQFPAAKCRRLKTPLAPKPGQFMCLRNSAASRLLVAPYRQI